MLDIVRYSVLVLSTASYSFHWPLMAAELYADNEHVYNKIRKISLTYGWIIALIFAGHWVLDI